MIIDSCFVVLLRRKRQYIKAGDVNCQIKYAMEKEQYLDNTELLEQNRQLRDSFLNRQQELLEKKWSWLQFLVTTMTAVLGILVSFGLPEKEDSFSANVCFVSGVVLLSLAIICLGVCLYGELNLNIRGIRKIAEEAKNALDKHCRVKEIVIHQKKAFRIFEIVGYICFGLSLISLCVFLAFCLL